MMIMSNYAAEFMRDVGDPYHVRLMASIKAPS